MPRTSPTPLKLQEALCELMWRQSYGRVTIDAICERAGVQKGSFYHFYPDKAALAVQAFDYFWETFSRPWMDAAFSPTRPPRERIAAWLAGGLEKALESQRLHGKIYGCPLYNVGSEISTLEPEVAAKIADLLRRYRRYLTSTLRDAVAEGDLSLDDPEGTARDVLTMVEGSLTQARISNSPEPLRRLPFSVGRLIGADLTPVLTNQ